MLWKLKVQLVLYFDGGDGDKLLELMPVELTEMIFVKHTAQKLNTQETADVVTFTGEILNGKLHFLCKGNSGNN